jgi:hypothetical protein
VNIGNNRVIGVKFLITGETYCMQCAKKYFDKSEGVILSDLVKVGMARYWALIRANDGLRFKCSLCYGEFPNSPSSQIVNNLTYKEEK